MSRISDFIKWRDNSRCSGTDSNSTRQANMWSKLAAVTALLVGILIGLWLLDDNKLDTIKGKRVLVTGASTGIGEQLAYHYARLGAHVAVTARRKDVLNQVIERCKQISPQNLTHFAIAADMSQLNQTQLVIEEAIALLGGLDIVVLNHIASLPISLFTGSPENLTSFDRITEVNFKSYVYLASYALPQIIANHGSIVVVNSLLGRIPHAFLGTYAASKHALRGFFESLRNQFSLLKQDVAVTICTLGLIGTDNAIEQLKSCTFDKTLATISPASPVDTALAIVTANARRQNDLYFPFWSTWSISLLRSLFPQTSDWIMVTLIY
ncbi:unnamed protein product [Lymnaea stagnalis]|uniref:Uncharacterized protein n=1 Tax=Lymnaea stagnalis TaxID=6523 RepID=A0AAV2I184_LYMST